MDILLDHIAYRLKKINEKRKRLTNKIFDNIIDVIDDNVKVIVVKGKIRRGVVGLIASKINSRYIKPTIVIDTDSYKGSARSVEPFNIYKNLKICQKEGILEGAGGHEMAAGIKLKAGKFDQFCTRINDLAKDIEYKDTKFDLELPLKSIDRDFLNDMYRLRPFGHKNRHPVIKSDNVKITNTYTIKDRHIKFKAAGIDAIGFNITHKFDIFQRGVANILYQPKISTFRGSGKIELIVRDLF